MRQLRKNPSNRGKAILAGLLLILHPAGIQAEAGTDSWGPSQDQVHPIEPPFGLTWGEDPSNLDAWANKNQFTQTKGKGKDGRDVVEIEGPFPDAEFNRLRFYFTENQLTEVELQFNETSKKEDRSLEFETFTKALAIKEQIDRQLGKGQLVKNEKGTRNGCQFQFIHQIWTDEEHSVWLAVFNASQPTKGALAIASLHYRWEKAITAAEKSGQKGNSSQK